MLQTFERIDALAVPALGVDIGLGLDIVDEVDESVFLNQLDLVVAFGPAGEELLMGL